jgi:transcriptional regulator with XRE-family HTH domain
MAPNHCLKRLRELRGWSQAVVAQHIGTDATTVSRWERGLFVPAPSFREKLCALFDANAEELGLVKITQAQPPVDEQDSSSFQPLSTTTTHAPLQEEKPQENLSDVTMVSLTPPSWSNQTDTYAYIVQRAAYDQHGYALWKEAYIQMLRGHRVTAQRLGEVGLRIFECIGHPDASVLREWLMQEVIAPPASVADVILTI